MRCSRRTILLLLSVAVAGLGLPRALVAQGGDTARVLEDLGKAIQEPAALELARCEVRAALLGRYNVTVRTAGRASTDGRGRLLSVTDGKLTVGIDASPLSSTLAAVEGKTGRLRLASREEAFRLGLPFYIEEVKVLNPNSVSYVVASNPAMKIEEAFARIEKNLGSFTGETVETTKRFASSAEAQRREFEIAPALTNDLVAYLSIVTLGSNEVRCLSSNEVVLRFPE